MRQAVIALGVVLFLAPLHWLGRHAPESEGGRTTIRFTAWGNEEEQAFLRELIDQFEAENPDIRVRFIHIPNQYNQVLLTMIVGGEAPDIFYTAPALFPTLTAKGIVMDITDRLETTGLVDDFFPAVVEAYRFDRQAMRFGVGRSYGVCKDWSCDSCVYYNRDMFREAGVPEPGANWTFADFLRTAIRLTKVRLEGRVLQFGVTPEATYRELGLPVPTDEESFAGFMRAAKERGGVTTQFGTYDNCFFEQWTAQAGGQVFSEDGKRCTLDSPEVIAGLQFAVDLATKYGVAPDYSERAQGTVDQFFTNQQAAMVFYGRWFTPIFNRRIDDFDWSCARPPMGVTDANISAGMCGYALYAKTRHPDEAWRFLAFLVGEEGQEGTARKGWNQPSNERVAERAMTEFLVGSPARDRKIQRVFLDVARHTRLRTVNPYIPTEQFEQILYRQYELAQLGRKTVAQAMADATVETNQAIGDSLRELGIAP